eukprot:7835390-Karenia_brevis.AAC.1
MGSSASVKATSSAGAESDGEASGAMGCDSRDPEESAWVSTGARVMGLSNSAEEAAGLLQGTAGS